MARQFRQRISGAGAAVRSATASTVRSADSERDQPGRPAGAYRPLRAAAREGTTCGVAQFYHELYEIFSDATHITISNIRKSQRAKPDRYTGLETRSSDTYVSVRGLLEAESPAIPARGETPNAGAFPSCSAPFRRPQRAKGPPWRPAAPGLWLVIRLCSRKVADLAHVCGLPAARSLVVLPWRRREHLPPPTSCTSPPSPSRCQAVRAGSHAGPGAPAGLLCITSRSPSTSAPSTPVERLGRCSTATHRPRTCGEKVTCGSPVAVRSSAPAGRSSPARSKRAAGWLRRTRSRCRSTR